MPWIITTLAGALAGVFLNNATSQPVQVLPGTGAAAADEGKLYKIGFFVLAAYVLFKISGKK